MALFTSGKCYHFLLLFLIFKSSLHHEGIAQIAQSIHAFQTGLAIGGVVDRQLGY
jgi:hypothetical protein